MKAFIVNGREKGTAADSLAYEDVVAFAGMTGTPSVTWRIRGVNGNGPGGGMHPGCDRVQLADGIVFNVAHTGNA